MAERKAMKPRTCDKCGESKTTDARGIREHSLACGDRKSRPNEAGA